MRGRSVLVAGVLVVACSHHAADSAAPPPHPKLGNPDAVFVEGRTFRDGRGRQLLFRGYNAKVNGIFDVSFDDGRTPNYTFPSLDEAGAQRMEELGFDVIRLCIDWSALEPQPTHYSADFFAELDAILALAKQHHLYVLLDMHQDAYSKEIGEDGAPLWAIVPPPEQILQGPSDDSRRLSNQVLKAGFSFFDDAPLPDGRTLQQAFIDAVSEMVKRHVGDPTVLGVEDFNEPVVLLDEKLQTFHQRFADALHAIDADLPIFFEPIATRNQFDVANVPNDPWSHGPGVYAPHIYTGQFSLPDQHGWASEDPAVLAPSMAHANDEVTAWGTPLFVTEYGCNVAEARGAKWFAAELDLQDEYLASSTAWAWEPGDWGFPPTPGAFTARPTLAHVVARPYPRAVAGDLLAIERPAPAHLIVHYRPTARTKGLPHEISTSADALTDWFVLCDGAPVSATNATGRASFVCPASDDAEHTFELVGTPNTST
jgi:hypothetical protein